MADVDINKFRASVVREGSKPASPGFIVSEGQSPTDPAGSGQNHLPVTIASAATGLSITDSQVLGGAGTVGQYIRGDGSLADFPESSGGGSSVSYYLNGSISQGTIGGVAYKELNKVPILGAGTDFTINADGYIASFLTDAGDPNLLEIPGGNWNFETYFSSSSSGGTPSFYVELYKYDGSTFTLLASNSSFPEFIAFGTIITPYFSTLAVPTTTLALTDRLAIRYYVTHSGRTITLHTEDNHLCQIVTTFTTGITALNGLTAQVQNFAVGTSGTDFAIASATATHTFNLPTASATNRGALSSADWTTFNGKQNALTNPVTGTGASGQVAYFTGTSAISSESNLFWDATNNRLGINNAVPTVSLDVSGKSRFINSVAGDATISTNNSNSSDDSAMSNLNFDGNRLRLGVLSTDGSYGCIGSNGANTGIAFVTNNTTWSEKMRLTSGGNLLVGTISDNGAKLQVSGSGTFSSSITAGGTQYLVNTSTGTGAVYQRILNTGGDVVIGINSSLGNSLASGGLAYATAIYNNSNTALQFGTNAAFNMTIAAGGNVLIGTTTDNGARLQVSGTGRFTDIVTVISSSSTGYVAQTTANSVYPYFRWIANNRSYWAAAIDFGTDATFKIGGGNTIGSSPFLTIDSGTNASTFTTTLAVTGASTFSGLNLTLNNTGVTGSDPLFTIQSLGGGNPRLKFLGQPGVINRGAVGDSLFFGESSDTGQYIFRGTGAVTFTGNINQNINDGTISLYKADGTTLKAYIGNLNGTTTDEGYLALYKTNVQKVAIRASGTSYFDGGNVLIGKTTDNGARLQVAATSAIVTVTSTTGTSFNGIELQNSGGSFYVGQDNSAGNFYGSGTAYAACFYTSENRDFVFFNGANQRMRISSAGDVFINHPTNVGEGKLRVSQDGSLWNIEARHTFSTQYFMLFRYNSTGLGSITGNGSSVAFNTTSDYRLKEDLKEIKGLEKVQAIKVYDYKWKSNDSRMDGVLAHELATVLPYAVHGEKDGEYMQGVDYSKLVPIMVKAIQELKQEIDTLKN